LAGGSKRGRNLFCRPIYLPLPRSSYPLLSLLSTPSSPPPPRTALFSSLPSKCLDSVQRAAAAPAPFPHCTCVLALLNYLNRGRQSASTHGRGAHLSRPAAGADFSREDPPPPPPQAPPLLGSLRRSGLFWLSAACGTGSTLTEGCFGIGPGGPKNYWQSFAAFEPIHPRSRPCQRSALQTG
jgi:hypothetical protein